MADLLFSTIEKVTECRRLIDYAQSLNLKDPQQLAELQLTNQMIQRLNKEVNEELKAKTKKIYRIKAYFALDFLRHVRGVVMWSMLSIATLYSFKLIFIICKFFWNLW